MTVDLEAMWAAAGALIADARDILDERPAAAAPRWAEARGWAAWLADLDEAALRACEQDGLVAHAHRLGAPPSLRALAERVDALRLPRIPVEAEVTITRRVKARKRAQVAAFAAVVVERFAGVQRVVDVGAGHGHLTRHLADALGVGAVGLEVDAARVQSALALGGAEFVSVDVFADTPDIRSTDLVVGLHACGALSDRLLDLVRASGAAFAVVGCCLHKMPTTHRAPRVPHASPALALPRAALGLANIMIGAQGVEASLDANLAARARRTGVQRLLAWRGQQVTVGEVMRGLNRRRAYGDFDALARQVLARRGLDPPTADELRRAAQAGVVEQASVRRWAIARRMLGRPLEVYVALDRALSMQRAGHAVSIGTLWPSAVSPRNIALLGHHRADSPRVIKPSANGAAPSA